MGITVCLAMALSLAIQTQPIESAPSCDSTINIVGTWSVENVGEGTTGQVTFTSDGSYTINSGTYNAGGTWFGATLGTYEVVADGAIAFTYSNWALPQPVSRIAIVQCASPRNIVHFVIGHTHDLEILTRSVPEKIGP